MNLPASCVLGILSLILSWTGIFGIIFSILSIVFSIIALKDIKKNSTKGKWMAVTGLILGIVALVTLIIITVIIALFITSSVEGSLKALEQNAANLSSLR